jgi:branched-chain amino acid transport system ATP-binding protein
VRLSSSLTVTDNVRLACRGSVRTLTDLLFRARTAEREVASLADQVLHDFQLVDVKGVIASELSFGRQKLLASACLVATQAPLLLLDEPFAGLSPSARELLSYGLGVAAKNATIIIVEHDLRTIEDVAGRLIVLARGQVVADDETGAVLRSAAVREALIG